MEKAPRNLIGPTVRRLRTQRDLSQSELAAKCQAHGWDVSRDIIAAIEGQVRCVTESESVALAAILKVTPQELLPSQALVFKTFASIPPHPKKK